MNRTQHSSGVLKRARARGIRPSSLASLVSDQTPGKRKRGTPRQKKSRQKCSKEKSNDYEPENESPQVSNTKYNNEFGEVEKKTSLESPRVFAVPAVPSKRSRVPRPISNRDLDRPLSSEDMILRAAEDKWPAKLDRFRITVFPRAFFGELKFLANGGLGMVLTSSLSITGMLKKEVLVDNMGTPCSHRRRTRSRIAHILEERTENMDVVLKCCLDPDDWNDEIAGYNASRHNRGVVPIKGVVLLDVSEVNKLGAGIKGYIPRAEPRRNRRSGRIPLSVPTMIFEKWDGSLHDCVENGIVAKWDLVDIVSIFRDLTDAVVDLHKHGQLHRDIKPRNCLFKKTSDGQIIAALCDLGLATDSPKTLPERATMTQDVGTAEYMAPEVHSGTVYSTPADVFSLCVTLQEIIEGSQQHKSYLTHSLGRLLAKGTCPRPARRPQAKELLSSMKKLLKKLAG